jgi:hypothetical protein
MHWNAKTKCNKGIMITPPPNPVREPINPAGMAPIKRIMISDMDKYSFEKYFSL